MSESYNPENDPLFADSNKARAKWVKWGKPGDYFKGTYLGTKMGKSPDGKPTPNYDFRAHNGSFHFFVKEGGVEKVEETPTEVKAGEFWSIGSLSTINKYLDHAVPGQIFGFRFQELVQGKDKTKNPTKVVNVYPGAMDPEYRGESAGEIDVNAVQM